MTLPYNILKLHPPPVNSTVATEGSTLSIGVTFQPNSSQPHIAWQHDGYALRNPRADVASNGSLTIEAVEPSDAGYYSLLFSSHLGCGSARFQVFVECEHTKFNCYIWVSIARGYADVDMLP